MRILVISESVPGTINENKPHHFLQELKPLSESGNNLCVATSCQPNYTFPGIQFRTFKQRRFSQNPILCLSLAHFLLKNHVYLPCPKTLKQFRTLLKLSQWHIFLNQLIAEFRPQIIHSHWAEPLGSAGFLSSINYNIPLVMTLRGYEHIVSKEFRYGNCLDPFYEEILTRALRQASAITICCTDSVSRLNDLGGFSSKVHHIFHAVDENRLRFSEDEITPFRQSNGTSNLLVITCIALLQDDRKGHRTLLAAFAKIRKDFPNVILQLIGDGPLRSSLEGLASELGVVDHVKFLGSIHPKQIGMFIRSSDITILPTHFEVFGNVVFESLLLGVPVISGAAGTAKDILEAKDFGLLFKPGDVDDCFRALTSVLTNLDIYKEKAARGREFVRREMNIKNRIDRFNNLYNLVTHTSS